MKKGFTLIELISVIVILSVIALISTPIITGIINKSKQSAYEQTVSIIEQSAYNYSIYNNLGYSKLYKSLDLSKIQEKGYLQSEDIMDPRNDEKMTGCVLYRWVTEENQYEFIYQEDCNAEELNPKITINVLNDNDKTWIQEYLKFEVNGTYDSYRYCVGNNDCVTNISYTGTTTLTEVGTDIYVCVTGYMENEKGSSSCTKAYNIDPIKPELVINSITTTSSKIIVNAECSDSISGVKNIQYSINDGEYQNNNIFSNLTSGTYNVKVKCTDNALNETIVEQTKTIGIPNPTIAQYSQTPENSTYVTQRIIRITYYNENVDNPKYYYSLDGSTWTQVTSTTHDVTFTSNGYLYAKTTDEVGNTANSSVYTVTNIDTTDPNVSIAAGTMYTDRTTVTATCTDTESGISKYEFSKDNGSTWIANGTTSSYTFTNLDQSAEYTFVVRCTNGSGLTNTASDTENTATIQNPTIAQYSQTPSNGTYATKRVIRITYSAANIKNPKYYYSLDGSTWTQVTSTTYDVTFTSNGYLYAKTVDDKGNTASAAAYTVTNIDTSEPSTSIATGTMYTDRTTITANCTDAESGISKYEFSKDNGSTFISNGTTKSYTFTNLDQSSEYTFAVRCTNGSGLTNTASDTESTATIQNPTITQASATIATGYTWATERVIRITYNNTNIKNPKYYYSLDGSTWTQVTSTTYDVTFTSNGYLYAKTVDDKGNTATAATYTVVMTSSGTPSKPVITGGSSSWIPALTPITINISTASTETSGISHYQYYVSPASTLTGGSWIDLESGVTSFSVTSSSTGPRYVFVRGVGNNGVEGTTSDSHLVAYFDPTAPTITVTVSGKVATITMSDNMVVTGYGINQSTTTAPDYTEISENSTTITYTATEAGDYVVWAKDVAGNVTTESFTIDSSAFSYAATATTSTYTATSGQSCNACQITSVSNYGTCYTTSGTQSTDSNYHSGTCANGKVKKNSICGYGVKVGEYYYYDCKTTYSCPQGGSLSGTTCTKTTYTCPDGGTLNASTNMCER